MAEQNMETQKAFHSKETKTTEQSGTENHDEISLCKIHSQRPAMKIPPAPDGTVDDHIYGPWERDTLIKDGKPVSDRAVPSELIGMEKTPGQLGQKSYHVYLPDLTYVDEISRDGQEELFAVSPGKEFDNARKVEKDSIEYKSVHASIDIDWNSIPSCELNIPLPKVQ